MLEECCHDWCLSNPLEKCSCCGLKSWSVLCQEQEKCCLLWGKSFARRGVRRPNVDSSHSSATGDQRSFSFEQSYSRRIPRLKTPPWNPFPLQKLLIVVEQLYSPFPNLDVKSADQHRLLDPLIKKLEDHNQIHNQDKTQTMNMSKMKTKTMSHLVPTNASPSFRLPAPAAPGHGASN